MCAVRSKLKAWAYSSQVQVEAWAMSGLGCKQGRMGVARPCCKHGRSRAMSRLKHGLCQVQVASMGVARPDCKHGRSQAMSRLRVQTKSDHVKVENMDLVRTYLSCKFRQSDHVQVVRMDVVRPYPDCKHLSIQCWHIA